ncbi:hypothetical protein OG508_28150 [Streptomyces sp. NBC_01108]|uniref:hypothetical protein n=1 Tax=Streptomyces sp. NBC_01108 TaxID=2903751 RepID=UPI00387362B9|nr:hypothetical protein OG508_28150 [Streptomyces sp. NBC_01108]
MAEEVNRVREALRALEAIPDAVDRAAACSELLREWPDLHRVLADVRQQAVITAKEQGHTYRAIGERMGVTGETAGQIAAGKNRASSA